MAAQEGPVVTPDDLTMSKIKSYNTRLKNEMNRNITIYSFALEKEEIDKLEMELQEVEKKKYCCVYYPLTSFITRVQERERLLSYINIEQSSPPPTAKKFELNIVDLFEDDDDITLDTESTAFTETQLLIVLMSDIKSFNQELSTIFQRIIRVLQVTDDHTDYVDYTELGLDLMNIVKRRIELRRCLSSYKHIANYMMKKISSE